MFKVVSKQLVGENSTRVTESSLVNDGKYFKGVVTSQWY